MLFAPLCIFFCLAVFWLFIDFSIFSSCKISTADAAVPLKLPSGGNDFNHQENQRRRERERNNSFSSVYCTCCVERGELGGSGPRFDPATPARRKRPNGARDEPRRDAKGRSSHGELRGTRLIYRATMRLDAGPPNSRCCDQRLLIRPA